MACILLNNFIRSQMPDNLVDEIEDETLSPTPLTENYFIEDFNSSNVNIANTFESMDSTSVNSKGKKTDKLRRTWTAPEEEVLIVALKDIISKGYKTENGFRNGYLPLLESALQNAFKDSDLRGHPHITLKIHVWKKHYGCLTTMLAKSGIDWNDTENTIDATNEAWDTILKVDNSARVMRYKRWPHYKDWCEIFGYDRATGDRVETISVVVHDVLNMIENESIDMEFGMDDFYRPLEEDGESMSVAQTLPSNPKEVSKVRSKKRKRLDDVDNQIVAAINNLADITKETISNLIKEMSSESKIEYAMDNVLATLGTIPELTSDEKVRVAELLVDNTNKLALFLRLNLEGKISLIKRILNP
ncbi:uncharacterized protein LOC142541796 [Primulina tabacum]|uniref:uncharacterized protein LOC142541796 n=1 Tax=Primulina tabacum TaxID=48773 RepID=UPI003F596177